MCSYAEGTGRYLQIALLLSTVTVVSQTAFQLFFGIFAESSDNSTLAACEILSILLLFDLKPTHRT